MYSKLYQAYWRLRSREEAAMITRHRQELEQSQWLSLEELQELQLIKLRRLLAHAYEHVPFYRQRFRQAGVHPRDIKTLADLRRIPILTKKDVQTQLHDLVATNYDRAQLHRDATGGSTGASTVFYLDKESLAYNKASKARYRKWYGFEMGAKVAFLWGAARDVPDMSLRARLNLILGRQRWLNSYGTSVDQMKRFAQEMQVWKPSFIVGYSSSLHLFARFLREHNLDGIHPQAIESSAEKLYDFQRELVEQVFGCRVFNAYGSREFGGVAAECEQHQGMHILADVMYVELIKDGQPVVEGDFGDIIITDLHNYAMPFIRYQIGDLGRPQPGPCLCGRGFARIAEIVGRSNAIVTTPSGHYVHGAFFSHLFYGVEEVRKFRIHQQSLTKVDVLIESEDNLLPPDKLETIRSKMQSQLGDQVTLEFKFVDSIPPLPSGKLGYLISDVPVDLALERSR
jgi:phenylacetate-CoA ligase